MSAAEDWDPQQWLEKLTEVLNVTGAGYMRMPKEEDEIKPNGSWPTERLNRTTFTAMTIGAISNALQELPGMKGHVGLVPLHDLTAALIDLGHGGRPSLLKSVPGVATRNESSSRRFVRINTIFLIALLERSGLKPAAGIRELAELLKRSGHKGSDGPNSGLITESAVERWWTASRKKTYAQKDPRAAAAGQRYMKQVETHPCWPFSLEQARAFVREKVGSPLMRSKT